MTVWLSLIRSQPLSAYPPLLSDRQAQAQPRRTRHRHRRRQPNQTGEQGTGPVESQWSRACCEGRRYVLRPGPGPGPGPCVMAGDGECRVKRDGGVLGGGAQRWARETDFVLVDKEAEGKLGVSVRAALEKVGEARGWDAGRWVRGRGGLIRAPCRYATLSPKAVGKGDKGRHGWARGLGRYGWLRQFWPSQWIADCSYPLPYHPPTHLSFYSFTTPPISPKSLPLSPLTHSSISP